MDVTFMVYFSTVQDGIMTKDAWMSQYLSNYTQKFLISFSCLLMLKKTTKMTLL